MSTGARVARTPGATASRGTIPVFRPDLTEEEIEAVAVTMRSGWIGAGPRVKEFEAQFAKTFGTAHAVAVATGTAALESTLGVLGVGPGDEVIFPSFTWVSVFQVVVNFGATPVFADIEPEYLTIDPEHVRRLISPRTKGIVAVHHGGQLADVTALRSIAKDHGLWLIDDAAHACGSVWHGHPVGSLCTMTCFSFNAMKNLSVGDGGIVTTNDQQLAQQLSAYRALGIDRDTFARYGDQEDVPRARWSFDVVSAGQRLHMNDIAASIGLVQLRRLPQLNRQRAELAARYDAGLSDIAKFRAVHSRPGTQPSHHMYTVRMGDRDTFIEEMARRGVSVGVHYIPIHTFTVARRFPASLPVTDKVWREVTTFPLYPSMTREEQDRVISAAHEVVAHR